MRDPETISLIIEAYHQGETAGNKEGHDEGARFGHNQAETTGTTAVEEEEGS